MYIDDIPFSECKSDYDVEKQAREIYLNYIVPDRLPKNEKQDLVHRFRKHVIDSGFAGISRNLCHQIENYAEFSGTLEMADAFRVVSLFESVYILDRLGFLPPQWAYDNMYLWLRELLYKHRPVMKEAFASLRERWNKVWWEELVHRQEEMA